MKRIKLSCLITIMLALFAVPTTAHDFEVGGVYYQIINENEVAVTYRGSNYYQYSNEYSGDIVIPEAVSCNGINYSVTAIGNRAFWECSRLSNISIPNTVTCIDSLAFYECYGLTNFIIPNSITRVEYGAFWLCTGLTSVTIGDSVTAIGDNAFHMCRGLTSIFIGNSVKSIGKQAFICCTSLTSVTIDNSVTSIGNYAFQECTALTNVTIGNSVTSMGDDAFVYCNRIKNLTWNAKNCSSKGNMPSSNIEQVSIGSEVEVLPAGFVSRSKISEVIIPNSVITIGNYAFNGCAGLSSIVIPNSVITLGEKAFNGCTELSSVTIGNSVSFLANFVFQDCSSLDSVAIPNSVTSIGGGAFSGCSAMKYVTIPNSVTVIDFSAFKKCSSLASINIPNSVISIGDAAFYQCYGLTSATIGNSVTSIGQEAFRYCSNLTTLTVGNSVSSIGSDAFSNCTAMTRVNISDLAAWCGIDFSYYGSNPLEYAHHLYLNDVEIIDLVIPNFVTKISRYAFYGCSNLTSVTIPKSVTSIGRDAFCDCSNLTGVFISDIAAWCNIDFDWLTSNPLYYANRLYLNGTEVTDLTIPNTVTKIGNFAFEYCNYLASVTLPNSIISIGNYAFQHINFLKSVTIPNSVTHIGNSAFDHCIGLKDVTIPNSVTYIGNNAFYYCYSITTMIITGEGEWAAGSLDCSPYYLYIDSRITSVKGIKINPKTYVYSYATIPPECDDNSFTSYSSTLHVPAASLAAYFTADYWSNFANITGDAVEPNIAISLDSVEAYLGDQFKLTASVTPTNATPNSFKWATSDPTVASVNSYGMVTAVGVGECEIIAECLYKRAICHVVVKDKTVTITLDQQEAMLLPNHMLILTPIPNPVVPELIVTSSDPSVAAARIVNNKVQVVGIKEGTTTITVGSADGTAIPATCLVTVYTEPGDVNCDGFVNISDVTDLIDYLLNGNGGNFSFINADCDKDGKVNITDVTMLIDYLLGGIDLNPLENETFMVGNVSFTLVYVKGGTFKMGVDSSNYDIAHQVTLSNYFIGQTEVTQELWKAVMGSNPSYFVNNQHPVDRVSWDDCQTFITKLNQMTGKNFRLPTEAEWEYAARGGYKSKGFEYAGSDTIDYVAWYSGNAGGYTRPVGIKAPNELELYDMSGNVQEWCQDWYGPYSSEAQTNPTGPNSGIGRVCRGGSIFFGSSTCCVSDRYMSCSPTGVARDRGFRIALSCSN